MAALLVDIIAAEIRRVDGNHDKGAGEIAEAIVALFTDMSGFCGLDNLYRFGPEPPPFRPDYDLIGDMEKGRRK